MTIHHRRIDDLAGQYRHPFAQHDGGCMARIELDTQVAVPFDDRRPLALVEVAALHVRDMRGGIRAPFTHRVRVLLRVLLHGSSDAPVGIALAQDGIHGAAEHDRIAFADLALVVVDGFLRIGRDVEAL